MTTIQSSIATTSVAPASSCAEVRLRRAMTVDSVCSGVAAIATLALAGPVAERMDVPTGVVFTIGAGVAVWAVEVGLLARADRSTVARWTPYVVALNALWVVATAVALVTGMAAGTSSWFLVPLAFVVNNFGMAQAWFLRRMT